MYDYAALRIAYYITLVALSGIATTCWVLYFYEVAIKSDRIRADWLKKRFVDLLLIAFVALFFTFILSLVLSGGGGRGRPHH